MSYSRSTIWRRLLGASRLWLSVVSTTVLIASSACSSAPPTRHVTLPELRTPLPEPIETLPVRWRVVTPETIPEGSDWALFALSSRDFEALSRNMAELRRWIEEAMWRLERDR